MMDRELRRTEILLRLKQANNPVSATALAKDFHVSRQVVVGDIALLRARGDEIISTARGYMMAHSPSGKYIGTIACHHDRRDTERELSTIVKAGGEILDVTISHQYYGDMTGQLNLATLEDVSEFVRHMDEAGEHLLLELTDGIHMHRIACADHSAFEGICAALLEIGVLYE